MITLKEQLTILDPKELVKIQLKNLELYTSQIKNLNFKNISKIENQEVESIQSQIIEVVDEPAVLFIITLNYELNFGE